MKLKYLNDNIFIFYGTTERISLVMEIWRKTRRKDMERIKTEREVILKLHGQLQSLETQFIVHTV